MNSNIYRNFILDNSLAAVSAVPYADHTLATDGINCVIHQIDSGGSNLSCHKTLRPLRRLRNEPRNSIITALGCCNERKLYFLDENLRESGYIKLQSPYDCNGGCDREQEYNCDDRCDCRSGGCDNGCNRGNGCNGGCGSIDYGCNGNWSSSSCVFDGSLYSDITDASMITMGEQNYIVAAFRKGAYLYDADGKCLTRLCKTDGDEILTDFIYIPDDTYAMATLCGNTQTVTVSKNGNIQSGILDKGYRLRMLFEQNGDIYGLFGRSYIYNRIIKIFSQNISLPRP